MSNVSSSRYCDEPNACSRCKRDDDIHGLLVLLVRDKDTTNPLLPLLVTRGVGSEIKLHPTASNVKVCPIITLDQFFSENPPYLVYCHVGAQAIAQCPVIGRM